MNKKTLLGLLYTSVLSMVRLTKVRAGGPRSHLVQLICVTDEVQRR